MNVDDLIAIDVHMHAEVSRRQPADGLWQPYEAAARGRREHVFQGRQAISETIAYYRERRIGLIMFTVDVAVDFPDMTIIIAHPPWPWQDEALSICLHKPNVYIDLSGWRPKYFPPELVQYANSQLKTKMLFGSDFPLIRSDRSIKNLLEAGFKPEVQDLILKRTAVQALNLDATA